jgi:predicted DNA-binding transcriptional regulator AlpA
MENITHLTVEDLGEREGVPPGTVYRWNYTGTGPRFMKVGKHVRYRIEDVEAWEQSKLSQPPDAA